MWKLGYGILKSGYVVLIIILKYYTILRVALMLIVNFNIKLKGVTRLKFKRRQPRLPLLPFPCLRISLLSPHFYTSYQLGGLGSAVSSPVVSGAKPQPLNDLVHIWAKKWLDGDNTVMDFESKYIQFSGVSESVSE